MRTYVHMYVYVCKITITHVLPAECTHAANNVLRLQSQWASSYTNFPHIFANIHTHMCRYVCASVLIHLFNGKINALYSHTHTHTHTWKLANCRNKLTYMCLMSFPIKFAVLHAYINTHNNSNKASFPPQNKPAASDARSVGQKVLRSSVPASVQFTLAFAI